MVGMLGQYLRLVRPYGMLFLGLAPLFGALANGGTSPVVLVVLLFMGMMYHVFTFVYNDVVDMAIDARSRFVAARPLLKGGVPKSHAIELAAGAVVVVVGLAVCTWSLLTVVLALAALGSAAVYNLMSKRGPFLEYVLGVGVFCLVLAGVLAVQPHVTGSAWIVAGAFFLQWVFSVGVAANLKDIEEDTKNGVFTSPTYFGVRHVSGRVIVSFRFQVFMVLVSVSYIVLLGLLYVKGYLSGFIDGIPLGWVGFSVISMALLVTTWGLSRGPSPSRERFLRYAGVHEGLALLLVPMALLSLLVSTLGVTVALLFFVAIIAWPLSWFRLLYGKKLIPLE